MTLSKHPSRAPTFWLPKQLQSEHRLEFHPSQRTPRIRKNRALRHSKASRATATTTAQMGIIRQATVGTACGAAVLLGYIRGATTMISPLPLGDAIYASNLYTKYNKHANPAVNDICTKEIPLDKIRPELLQKEGDLALEFCRGVWSGLGICLLPLRFPLVFFPPGYLLAAVADASSTFTSLLTNKLHLQATRFSAATSSASITAPRPHLSFGHATSSPLPTMHPAPVSPTISKWLSEHPPP